MKINKTVEIEPAATISEATNESRLTNMLLNGSNFSSWVKAVRVSLISGDYYDNVTGECAQPNAITHSAEFKKWRKSDYHIMKLIWNSIEPKLAEIFTSAESSKELWDSINKHYNKKRNLSHVYHLKQAIKNLKQEGRPILDYFTKLKKGWEELQTFLAPTTDPKIIQEREVNRIYEFLSGLDASYEPSRAQILLATEPPSLDDVVIMIQGEESRRLVMGGTSVAIDKPESQAMVARGQNPRFEKKKGRSEVVCDHCKNSGHEKERCWFLHPHLRPKWWKEGNDQRGGDRADKLKGEKKGYGAALAASEAGEG